jgi:hypothetical protein
MRSIPSALQSHTHIALHLVCGWGKSYLFISPAVPRNPFHINITIPKIAAKRRNLVRVRKFHMAREGGSRAFAAFQFTPPLGSNMLGRADTPSGVHESTLCLYSPTQPVGAVSGQKGGRHAGREEMAEASGGVVNGGVGRGWERVVFNGVVVAVECRA